MPRKKKRNTIIEKLLIENYAAEGKSLARWEGKVVFVERTVPGDVVDVFLFKNKKDWAEGYPLVFHELSPKRATPFCRHYGDCGGCQWQSVPYAEQLSFKFQQVKDALQRIGKLPLPEFMPILGCEEDRHYRNKLEYTFGTYRYVPDGEYVRKEPGERKKAEPEKTGAAGFHAKGLFDKIVDISECHLQPEPSNKVREAVRQFALENDLSYYDVRHHTGFLRNIQLRICATGEVMVNVIVGEDDFAKTEPLLQYLMQQVPEITTLLYTVNTKKNDSLYDLEPVAYSGKGYVIEKLEDFQFKIGPKSFFQTNTKQAEKLYQVTRDFAELTGNETVYDLYCGTGSIGIFVSRKAKKIIGVEVIAEAIEDAKENALLNNLQSSEFFAGDVIKICNDDFFAAHGRPDVVITDPPRAGMHPKLVEKLLEMAAPVIVYVSCNPATQARDLNLLGEKYEVTKVQPVDMFPQTHHIENVVQLKLKKQDI
ncbi:MAG TPA: 23S rRNA (uracil(1939)-C(5))-methyltransferase RlmD [Chitinophagaceae bacterium]|jgi:23S rRNA (uracil1939-C5)-methyltransferase|nr:23S rRNA (uracil(1939)-C(5))-methyltransferase RlmD [Chitinophagaceae bacterium]HMU59382.1 23S rRNA (uracil(1939)-C(5))-methyltransferase RlmD [Chitinophagaceae bacterium]